MPILQTMPGSTGWGRVSVPKGLYWVLQNVGSGYGSNTRGALGSFYVQTYSNTFKFNKNGEFVWGRALGAGNLEAIGVDSSENVYVSGASNWLVAKYNSNGQIQWQKNYALGLAANSQDMVTTNTGTSYIAGGRGDQTFASVMAINTDGALLWSTYNTTSATLFLAVGHHATPGIVVASGYHNNGSVIVGLVTAFNSSNGSVLWQRTFTPNDGNGTFATGCAVDSSGNVYVSGWAGSPRKNFLIKFNSSGSVLWTKDLEIPGVYSYNDYGSVDLDSSGTPYLSFYWDYNNNEYPTKYGGGFAKFNASDGSLQFIRRINNLTGVLRINVNKTDATVALMGTSFVAKLKGDGSGLGTYPAFTYDSTSQLQSTTISMSFTASGFSYTGAGYADSSAGYSASSVTATPTITYIGTEVG
jgi:hypothetical protein